MTPTGFRNVLVGIDGSTAAQRALSSALDIVKEARGRLGLLGFIPPPCRWAALAPLGNPAYTFRAQLEQDAQRQVEIATLAVPGDVPVTKLVRRGTAQSALLNEALVGTWDLVIVSRGSCFVRRRLLSFERSRWPPEVSLMLVD